MPALLIGFMAGVFCYLMAVKVKNMIGYDDSLDAFGVHGPGERWAHSLRAFSPPVPSTPPLAKEKVE
jgi:hypothetical protein